MEATIKRLILSILDASNLQQCGKKLEKFTDKVQALNSADDADKCMDMFWALLKERSAIQRDFENPDNRGWHICTPEQRIATCLSADLVQNKTLTEDLEHLRKYAQELQSDHNGTTGICAVGEETLNCVLNYLEEQYSLPSRLFSNQCAEFILLPDFHKNGSAFVQNRYYAAADAVCSHFAFFAKSVYSDMLDSLFSPVYIVVHELCVALCTVACSRQSANLLEHTVPEAWLPFLPEGSNEKEHKRQKELIVQALLLTILADAPFQKGPLLYMELENEKALLPMHKKLLQEVLNSL